MNILIFAVTLILLLATLSYEGLSNYLNTSLSRKQWQEFMQNDERGAQHLEATQLYKFTKVKSGNGNPQKKVEAIAYVNFGWFMTPQKREAQPQIAEALQSIGRNLIIEMYGNEPFFKELQLENPGFLDKIFDVLKNPIDASGKPLTIKNSADLNYIAWDEDKLHKAFILMLSETYDGMEPIPQTPNIVVEEETETPNPDDHFDVNGYKSLSSKISFDSRYYKIRVYRAPKEVLIAVYGSKEAADTIMLARKRLYLEVLRGKAQEEATAEFEHQFAGSAPAPYVQVLDYTVNKTNPDEVKD